jgi:hypothetical protein
MEPSEKAVRPDAICCGCEEPMKLSKMNPHRFSFRALFTQYECAKEPQCLGVSIYTFEVGPMLGFNKIYGEKVNRVECNVCGELSDCYIGCDYVNFCGRHAGHIYKNLEDYIKDNMTQRGNTFLYTGLYHMECYKKDREDLKLLKKNNNGPTPLADSYLWHLSLSSLFRIGLTHNFKYVDLFEHIRYEYGARMLTYKKAVEGPIICILCDAEYVCDVPPEMIYEHFIDCLKVFRSTIFDKYVTARCERMNTSQCEGKIKCDFCNSRADRVRVSVTELIKFYLDAKEKEITMPPS